TRCTSLIGRDDERRQEQLAGVIPHTGGGRGGFFGGFFNLLSFSEGSPMQISTHGRRRGFTLIAVLVVVAIIAGLIGALLPAGPKVREASAGISCTNNMKQIGIAFHKYHDEQGQFPNEGGNGGTGQLNVSFYTLILPNVEQDNLYRAITNGTAATVNPGAAVA